MITRFYMDDCPASRIIATAALVPFIASMGCGGGNNNSSSSATKATSITSLKTIATVSSTVDPVNGDNNPYALAFAPTTFTGDGNPAHIQPGDLVVSNFSNAAGAQSMGTTFEALRNGVPVPVFSQVSSPVSGGGTVTTSGAIEMAFGSDGTNWIANLGPNLNGSQGNVQVVNPAGTVLATLTDPRVIGGFGQAYNGGYIGIQAFFTVNITNGTVARIIVGGSTPPFTYQVLTPSLAHTATSARGAPNRSRLGMAWGSNDTLYVVNGANNTIIAIPNASTTTAVSSGTTIFTGAPLAQPILMTMNPINGNLIVANQNNNNIVEITTSGKVVGTKTVDPMPVNTTTGVGSGLFGIVASTDASGNLVVYFTDDNDNTVKKLSK